MADIAGDMGTAGHMGTALQSGRRAERSVKTMTSLGCSVPGMGSGLALLGPPKHVASCLRLLRVGGPEGRTWPESAVTRLPCQPVSLSNSCAVHPSVQGRSHAVHLGFLIALSCWLLRPHFSSGTRLDLEYRARWWWWVGGGLP